MHNTRHFPAYDNDGPAIFELVKSRGYDREISDIWEGNAELTYYSNTLEDLQAIAPREIMKGYRFSFGYTVHGGEVLTQHRKESIQ